MKELLNKIQNLVGEVSPDQMRFIDPFVIDNMGIFIPVAGPCYYSLSVHEHPSYMFVISFNNRTKVIIDNKTLDTEPEKIYVFSPGIIHQEVLDDEPPRYMAIMIDKKFFEDQLKQYSSDIKIFTGNSYKLTPQVITAANKFILECNNNLPGSASVLESISKQLTHYILRAIFNYKVDNHTISERLEINRSIEYIHTHLENKITIDDLTKIARMSSSHFSRIFKNETTKTPIDYIKHARLEKSKKLLKHIDKSITEIALECGFNSSAYLSDCFAKEFKITPSEYRKIFTKNSL